MPLGWFFEAAFLVAGYNCPDPYLNSTIILFDNHCACFTEWVRSRWGLWVSIPPPPGFACTDSVSIAHR